MHVRKTESTWSDIKTKIHKMFEERSNHASGWHHYGLSKQEFDEICWRSFVSVEQETTMQQMGALFFTKTETVKCLIKNSNNEEIARYTITFDSSRLAPEQWDSYYSDRFPVVTDSRIVEIATERNRKMKAVDTEKTDFVQQVFDVWAKSASVNAFVKTWPPGRDLLPLDVIEKLNEKKEREAKTEALSSDTINLLNTRLLRARVAA